MSDGEPRIQIETCLAELQQELASLGVTAAALCEETGRQCLEARDRWGRPMRIYVYAQFYWFMWGAGPDERHSVFRVGETAIRLARVALNQGWPHQEAGQRDLTRTLDRFLH
jgi:hypothetical protein